MSKDNEKNRESLAKKCKNVKYSEKIVKVCLHFCNNKLMSKMTKKFVKVCLYFY